jgi:hypothetical protein
MSPPTTNKHPCTGKEKIARKMASIMPTAPKQTPFLEVAAEDRLLRERMNRTAETRYDKLTRSEGMMTLLTNAKVQETFNTRPQEKASHSQIISRQI